MREEARGAAGGHVPAAEIPSGNDSRERIIAPLLPSPPISVGIFTSPPTPTPGTGGSDERGFIFTKILGEWRGGSGERWPGLQLSPSHTINNLGLYSPRPPSPPLLVETEYFPVIVYAGQRMFIWRDEKKISVYCNVVRLDGVLLN